MAHNSAHRYLKDLIEIFEEYEWDRAYHALREWIRWRCEHVADFHGRAARILRSRLPMTHGLLLSVMISSFTSVQEWRSLSPASSSEHSAELAHFQGR